MIDWGIVARPVHILAIVVWIGGVWFITTVLLPGMKHKPQREWIREFDGVERRFAPQAQIAALLVLLSRLYMLYQYHFTDGHYWWMHLMVFVWLLFAALLVRDRADDNPPHRSESPVVSVVQRSPANVGGKDARECPKLSQAGRPRARLGS